MDSYCTSCRMNTAGQHELNCPMTFRMLDQPVPATPINVPPMWICNLAQHATLERDRDALAAFIRQLFVHFTPEHIDAVSGTTIGTDLYAALASPSGGGATMGCAEHDRCEGGPCRLWTGDRAR